MVVVTGPATSSILMTVEVNLICYYGDKFSSAASLTKTTGGDLPV
jgi:hypothetical protein